ncbi:MAG: Eco57I restriction-modification methylase domain-containing protein, partial [Caldisphaera sp.]
MTETSAPERNYNIDFEMIKELISKYEQIKKSGEIKRYNEESTKKDFILPLFEALGWNVYNRGSKDNSVSAEETISKKRVDYGFRINGIPKFFLEAKSLKEENIQTNS